MTEPPVNVPHAHGNPLSALTRKIGPLPGFVWVLLAVGAYAGYRWYQQRNGATVSNPLAASGAVVTPDASVAGGDSLAGGFGGSSAVPSGVVQTTPIPKSDTNAEWAANIVTAEIAANRSGSAASNALAHYLGGNTLSASESALVSQLLQRYGPPPQGLIPINTTPATPAPKSAPPKATASPIAGYTFYHDTRTGAYYDVNVARRTVHRMSAENWARDRKAGAVAQNVNGRPKFVGATLTFVNDATGSQVKTSHPTPKPASHTYVVKSGDTLSSIAQHFYGRASEYPRIASANHITNPNLIHPGQRLVIPA